MIRYSLRKILNRAGNSSKEILKAFTAHITTRLPTNRRDPLYKYYYKDFSGESFMVNPFELTTYHFKWKPKEIAEYICLAAYRNYGDYLVSGDKSLDLFHSPIEEDKLNNNRLLRVKDGRIYFYYEEDLKRRNKLWV